MEIPGLELIKSSSKALNTAIFLMFWLNFLSAQCLDKRGEKYYSEPSFLPEPHSFKNRIRRISLSIACGISTGLIFSLLFALLVKHFVRYICRKPVPKSHVVFSPKISPGTLKSALANEPQLLGSCSSRKYYKAVLDNGLTVAVKRLNPFEDHSSSSMVIKRKVQHELEMLAGLRHRNLMSLRLYVCESGVCSLVYDYMPNGSLEDVMKRVRERQSNLEWESRLRIAVGISRGLHYLHFIGEPRRLHYNLKPSNVILDSEFEPRLGDYGLAGVVPNFGRAVSGYVAPEFSQHFRYTDKSDVFSFGVILGVLLTGRDPLDPFFSGRSMGQWLRYLQQAGEAREALDKSILGDEVEEHEMLMAVRIAVVCQSELPPDRPSSDELVSMLTQLSSY